MFCIGLLLTVVLMSRKVPGAILISILGTTILAVAVNSLAHLQAAQWGLIQPALPRHLVATPDFALLGRFSLGGGFVHAGIVTAVVFVFTLILSDFFDAMGTIVGVTAEAGLLDPAGEVPRINRVLFVDGLAAVAGGAGSCSSNTSFVESAAGVGEGARTGLAAAVTGVLLLLTTFLTPLSTIVPQQAAAPALVVVGFLMVGQLRAVTGTTGRSRSPPTWPDPDALHLLDHQRHRRLSHHVRRAQDGGRPGPRDPLADVDHCPGLHRVLRDEPDRAVARSSPMRAHTAAGHR